MDEQQGPVRLGGWLVEVDRQATQRAYLVCRGGADDCTCVHCMNFAAARDLVYPPAMLDLLEQLGINPRCEAEVDDLAPSEDGRRLSRGWFHFVGSVVAEGAGPEPLGKHVQVWFSRRADLLLPTFEGQPVVQLEWSAQVPWVLDVPPSDVSLT